MIYQLAPYRLRLCLQPPHLCLWQQRPPSMMRVDWTHLSPQRLLPQLMEAISLGVAQRCPYELACPGSNGASGHRQCPAAALIYRRHHQQAPETGQAQVQMWSPQLSLAMAAVAQLLTVSWRTASPHAMSVSRLRYPLRETSGNSHREWPLHPGHLVLLQEPLPMRYQALVCHRKSQLTAWSHQRVEFFVAHQFGLLEHLRRRLAWHPPALPCREHGR